MDACPVCKDGIVSVTARTCDKCGYTIDRDLAVWG
jgi:hypothetical protein